MNDFEILCRGIVEDFLQTAVVFDGKRKFEVLRITMLLRKQDKVVLDGDREDEQG